MRDKKLDMQLNITRRKVLTTAITATTLSITGCTQSKDETASTPTSSEELSPTATPLETQTTTTMDEIAYSTKEVRDSQVLKDGLSAGDTRHQHVVFLKSVAEADRLKSEQIDSEAQKFVAETDFDTENLLVLQVTLPSSSGEFTIETVGIRGDEVHVQAKYVSNPGPQNEILETELIRFTAPSDRSVTGVVIHAENYPYGDQNQTTFTPTN